MTDFLAANPKAARASNAQYWLGRSYDAQERHAEAAKAFLDGLQELSRRRARGREPVVARQVTDRIKEEQAGVQRARRVAVGLWREADPRGQIGGGAGRASMRSATYDLVAVLPAKAGTHLAAERREIGPRFCGDDGIRWLTPSQLYTTSFAAAVGALLGRALGHAEPFAVAVSGESRQPRAPPASPHRVRLAASARWTIDHGLRGGGGGRSGDSRAPCGVARRAARDAAVGRPLPLLPTGRPRPATRAMP